ncbi:MAG: hypothetical protein JXA14_27980 [Anaerolineae bacterium]|nr:hypothetical protein [Anaerolineae bacterium]
MIEENVRLGQSEHTWVDSTSVSLIRPGLACDLAVLLALAMVALAFAWVYRNFAQDDAFITYRYARNLANGYGFVYNRGESVLGTTTPLYTLLLAALALVFTRDIPLISHFVSALSLWVSGVALYNLGRQRSRHLAVAAALVFASNPLLISSVGMETLFLIALMLMTLVTYCNKKLWLTGFLLGLLLLTRLETVLFAGILGVHFLWQRKQLPYWLLIPVVVIFPWLVFAWRTFGSVIPHSAQTKMLSRAAGQSYSFLRGALIWWGVYIYETAWYIALFPVLLSGLIEAWRRITRIDAYTLVLIWTVVYFVAASFVAGSFPWYYGALIPGFAILVSFGGERLAKVLDLCHTRGGWITTDRMRTIGFSAIVLGVLVLQLSTWSSYWVRYEGQIVDRRYVGGREIAVWLNEHGNECESVAVQEIGVVGYFVDMQVVDLYGLVTPSLVPYLLDGNTDVLSHAITLFEPDYVLARQPHHISLLDASSMYRRVEVFGDGTFILYGKQVERSR